MSASSADSVNDPKINADPSSKNSDEYVSKDEISGFQEDGSRDLEILPGDPLEPGKQETIGHATDTSETIDIDKIIGRGLKHPPVQDDGLW